MMQNTNNVKYTVNKNEYFGSVEIRFDGIPAQSIRTALKELSFRWNPKKGIWYGFSDVATVAEILGQYAEAGNEVQTTEAVKKEAQKKNYLKFDKEYIRAEFEKLEGSKYWADYHIKRTLAVVELSGGELITIDKQGIETRFCFGENGYDYDEALAAADNARKSHTYFLNENMRRFRDSVATLENALKGYESDNGGSFYRDIVPVVTTYRQTDSKVKHLEFKRLSDVLEDLGGSAFLKDIPGQTITDNAGHKYKALSLEDITEVLNGYRTAAEAHEKKIRAYLKRYGTSKVHSWTYWIDA